MVSRQRQWQRKQIAQGKCSICGKLEDDGLRNDRCEDCRIRLSQSMRIRYQKLKIQGRCVTCGEPNDSQRVHCEACRDRERARIKRGK